MSDNETIEEVYDTINELTENNEILETNNKNHENEIVNNKKDIEESNQKIEKIMKDLIDGGGFQKDEMTELKMLFTLINNSSGEYETCKNSMSKCLELLINFSNQYLEIYEKSNSTETTEVSSEDKLNELLLMSKEDLVEMCKDNDISHSGSKKKLAQKILDTYNL